ncbi:alpha/beta hydrolase, partial [Dermatophilus congolensis]|uniref:alpha/beta hydrolase n=1 Tax=Dermatophilus congolensis TaxID=1863 RepID=UPI001AB02B99
DNTTPLLATSLYTLTALTAHRAEPATRMIGIEDEGSHGTYLQGNPCATPLINTYLTTGKLPATDIVCPGTPLPNENRLYPVLGDLHNDLNP